MFTAVAFVPVAPLLLLGPARAADPVLEAVDRALAPVAELGLPTHLLLADSADAVTIVGLGAPQEVGAGPDAAPVSANRPWRWSVAASLLARQGMRATEVQELSLGSQVVEPAEPACLVIAADGSAKRSDAAPGSFDPRSAEFDAAVLAAIDAADPTGLANLDTGLGARLLADGAHVWVAAGTALRDRSWRPLVAAELADPFGVAYLTGAWVSEGSLP